MEGEKLATAIQRQILAKLNTFNCGVKPANFFVLRYSKCPAVLVETAFIDNYHDNELLSDYEDEFARAIACGITDYVANL